jgi:predicted acetyltransferase
VGELAVRAVAGEEVLSAVAPLRAYAFQASPRPLDEEELRRRLPYASESRVLVAFDGDRPVATATALPMTQSVRGAVLAMSGVAGVAVHPGARRRGLARRLVGQLLAEGEAAGQALSCLYPFRESFYGRLGYVAMPQLRIARLDPRNLQPLLALDLGGSVDLVALADGLEELRGLLTALQPGWHGLALRGAVAAGAAAEVKHWLALARDDTGEVVGALQYEIRQWRGELHAEVLLTRTVSARYQLLQWLARHADQVTTAVLKLPPDTLVENWLADIDVTTGSRTDFVTPMARVLSVRGLAGIGCGSGSLTIALRDVLCPWNDGTYTLAGEGGALGVTPGGAPEVALTPQGLSALVYGGYDPAELPVHGWGDPDAAMCGRLRALFPPPPNLPFLYEEF